MNANEVKKDLYKSKNMAKLSHYVSGNLYYTVELADGTYQFPIATVEFNEDGSTFNIGSLELSEDLGTTTFEAEMKGSDLNRWISKAIDKGEFIKVGNIVDENLYIPDYIRNNSNGIFNGKTYYEDYIQKLVWEED